MSRTETFAIKVNVGDDEVEVGTAEIIVRPSADAIDDIQDKFTQLNRQMQPRSSEGVTFVISKITETYEVKDPDTGQVFKSKAEISKLPADVRLALWDRCWAVVAPLVPNLTKSGS
jgi:hypothetical protein